MCGCLGHGPEGACRIRIAPATSYILLTAWSEFALATIVTSAVYAIVKAGLNPFELLLVGAVLEGSVLIAEVPTGIVADAYSRRRSVIIGFALMGLGFIVWGSSAHLATILAAQVLWGVGFTFTSGAKEAWISDEVGESQAGGLFLRASQIGLVVSLPALFFGVGLAVISLHLPFLVAGGLFLALSAFLLVAMREHGFVPTRGAGRVFRTVRASAGTARRRPIVLLTLAVAAIFGASSEAFDRLWPAHLLEQVDLPSLAGLDPLVWFAVIAAGGRLLGVGVTDVVRRKGSVATDRGTTGALAALTVVLAAGVTTFAFASTLSALLAAYWTVTAIRRAHDPVFLAWINRGLDSSVRATVLSLHSQADALGQVAFGPMVGAVATLASIRTGLTAGALMLLPSLGLFGVARRRARGGTPSASTD